MAFMLSEAARTQIQEVLKGEQNLADKKVYLRVGVKGGGCSGFSYLLELADEVADPINPQDKIFEFPGIKVAVDLKSYLYLAGSTLDYEAHGLTGGFVFQNPQAKSSCGCGTSFSA